MQLLKILTLLQISFIAKARKSRQPGFLRFLLQM